MPSIISGLQWVPRGATAPRSKVLGLSRPQWEEIKAISTTSASTTANTQEYANQNGVESSDTAMDPQSRRGECGGGDEVDEIYDLDNYDNDGDDVAYSHLFGIVERDLAVIADTTHPLPPDADCTSDEEADTIEETDTLLITALAATDVSTLEVFVYHDDTNVLYPYCEFLLNDMPASIAWINTQLGTKAKGNLVVVGQMDSTIDFWDLDVRDSFSPMKRLKGKQSGDPDAGAEGHTGAVMSLHVANTLMASGSADKTVRVWDIEMMTSLYCYKHHTGEVQCVVWHPLERSVMSTAGYDGKLCLFDVRQPLSVAETRIQRGKDKIFPTKGEWNPSAPNQFTIGQSDGRIVSVDIRKFSAASRTQDGSRPVIWSKKAHEQACSLSFSTVDGLLITSGEDKFGKVWDVRGTEPDLVFAKNLRGGPLLDVTCNPSYPQTFAFSGTDVVIWDLVGTAEIVERFSLIVD